ncbi:unnamed protein product, partial [Symbiodinium sp. KB8]
GEAGLTVSSRLRLAGASDRADAGGVNSKLSPVPQRKAIADDLFPACVGRTGCAVVAERRSEEEHPELCGGDGDCFENRADCKAADGVWPSLGQPRWSQAWAAYRYQPRSRLVVVICRGQQQLSRWHEVRRARAGGWWRSAASERGLRAVYRARRNSGRDVLQEVVGPGGGAVAFVLCPLRGKDAMDVLVSAERRAKNEKALAIARERPVPGVVAMRDTSTVGLWPRWSHHVDVTKESVNGLTVAELWRPVKLENHLRTVGGVSGNEWQGTPGCPGPIPTAAVRCTQSLRRQVGCRYPEPGATPASQCRASISQPQLQAAEKAPLEVSVLASQFLYRAAFEALLAVRHKQMPAGFTSRGSTFARRGCPWATTDRRRVPQDRLIGSRAASATVGDLNDASSPANRFVHGRLLAALSAFTDLGRANGKRWSETNAGGLAEMSEVWLEKKLSIHAAGTL